MEQTPKSNIHVSEKRVERFGSDMGPYGIVPLWILMLSISDRAVRLFALLASKYCDKLNRAFPSRTTIARDLDCSLDSADRAIRELVSANALAVERRQLPSGDYTSNHYSLFFSNPTGSLSNCAADLAAPARPPSRTSAATRLAAPMRPPSRTGAATGTRPTEPDQERTPPNPLAGGRPSTRKPSKAEHDWASRVLATYRGGCPHDPTCDTRAKCIGKLVMFQRQQTLEGMTEEMNA